MQANNVHVPSPEIKEKSSRNPISGPLSARHDRTVVGNRHQMGFSLTWCYIQFKGSDAHLVTVPTSLGACSLIRILDWRSRDIQHPRARRRYVSWSLCSLSFTEEPMLGLIEPGVDEISERRRSLFEARKGGYAWALKRPDFQRK